MGFKYCIQDENGGEVYQSPIYEEQVTGEGAEDHLIKYMFISIPTFEVKEKQRLHLCHWCAT